MACLLVALSFGPARGAEGEKAVLANDNQRAPFLSAYRWDVGGLAKGEHDAFDAWLNRTSVWPESHQPKDTWNDIEGATWQLKPWSE